MSCDLQAQQLQNAFTESLGSSSNISTGSRSQAPGRLRKGDDGAIQQSRAFLALHESWLLDVNQVMHGPGHELNT